ncbi:MAG: ATPase, T2SS/T4P/T4SS family, partial [Desulfohalobiaceae bacterium]
MAKLRKIRLGDLLVQEGKINEDQLQRALQEQKRSGGKLGKVLIQMGYIQEDDLLQLLSKQLDIPFIDLRSYKYDPEVVRTLSETHARRFRAILLNKNKDGALVGMADPTDLFAVDQLGKILQATINPAVVRDADLLNTIDSVYRRTQEIHHLATEVGQEMGDEDEVILENMLAEAGPEDAPVARLLQSMFEDSVQIGASDIHVEPGESSLHIRQRVDGMLQEQTIRERQVVRALVSRLKLMCGLNISERRLPQDGRFNMRVKNRSIDVRLSTMPTQFGESVVMRLLDQSHGLLSLDRVGMPKAVLQRFRAGIHYPQGLVLVTGPTGSGKTTTLYGALSELNRPEVKIISVEDPVEYRLPRINQVQINSRIGLSFASVLRSALRQDPDILMVGEMRDEETAEIGLRAAMTGHLVLSTLHTNDAVSTALRLLDMGVAGYMVASSLRAVLSQRLVRRICSMCMEEDPLDVVKRNWLRAVLGEEGSKIPFKRGEGCSHCNNTGYRGRIGVFELLEIDDTLADALRRGASADFARAARNSREFRSLTTNALDYAKEGITSLDEV